MTFRDAVGIFVRTFAALAGAGLLAVQGLDWSTGDLIRDNALALGLMLASALIGSLVAVGWAFVSSPAGTRLEKSVRAAVEKIAGGVAAVALNAAGDYIALGKLLPSIGIAAVLAFAVTYLSYIAPPAVTDGPPPA